MGGVNPATGQVSAGKQLEKRELSKSGSYGWGITSKERQDDGREKDRGMRTVE